MANLHFLLMLFSLVIVAVDSNTTDIANGAQEMDTWFNTLHLSKEKTTRLHFYVQDILTGPNPTNIQVASASTSSASPTSFGIVAVLDDPIRDQPSPNATILGRVQGIFAFASLEETSLHMTLDLLFTSGKFNGSTLSVVGRNPYLTQNRELPIVGGSGAFRLARGVLMINTVSLNSSTGDAFFDYNLCVIHYP